MTPPVRPYRPENPFATPERTYRPENPFLVPAATAPAAAAAPDVPSPDPGAPASPATRVIASGLSSLPGGGLVAGLLNTERGRRLFRGMADPRAALRAVDAAGFGIPRRLAAAMSPAGYTAGAAAQQRERDAFQQQYPETANAADLTGILASAGPASQVATGALRALPGVGRALRGAEAATGIRAALTRGAENVAVGAGVGAAAGAGQAQPGEEGRGAVGGAILGGLGSAVVGAGVGAFRGVRNLVRGRPGAEVVGQRIAASGETLDDVAARASEQVQTGRNPKLVEVMDATGEDLAGMAGAQSEEAAMLLRRAGDAMARNRSGVAEQLAKDVGDVLDVTPKPIQSFLDDIERVRVAKAREMYPLLHADTRPIRDARIATFFERGIRGQPSVFARAHDEALDLAVEQVRTAMVSGEAAPPAFQPILNEAGELVAYPNIATMDWIKQGADRLLRKPPTAGGLDKAMARQLRTQLRTWRQIADAANPDYGRVRRIQESLFTAQEVLSLGQKLGRSGVTTPDRIMAEARKIAQLHGMDALPNQFQRLLRIGAADGLAQRVAQSGVNPLAKASTLQQVAALGGDTRELTKRVTMTLESQQAANAMAGAAPRVASRAVGDYAAVGADVGTGNVTGGIRNFAKAQVLPRIRGITPRNAPDVADILNFDAPRAIAEIRQAQRTAVTTSAAAAAAQRRLAAGVALLLNEGVSP